MISSIIFFSAYTLLAAPSLKIDGPVQEGEKVTLQLLNQEGVGLAGIAVSAAGGRGSPSCGARSVEKRKPPVTARTMLAAANLKTLNMVWVLPGENKRCHGRRCWGV